jgi:hypothetical protein
MYPAEQGQTAATMAWSATTSECHTLAVQAATAGIRAALSKAAIPHSLATVWHIKNDQYKTKQGERSEGITRICRSFLIYTLFSRHSFLPIYF